MVPAEIERHENRVARQHVPCIHRVRGKGAKGGWDLWRWRPSPRSSSLGRKRQWEEGGGKGEGAGAGTYQRDPTPPATCLFSENGIWSAKSKGHIQHEPRVGPYNLTTTVAESVVGNSQTPEIRKDVGIHHPAAVPVPYTVSNHQPQTKSTFAGRRPHRRPNHFELGSAATVALVGVYRERREGREDDTSEGRARRRHIGQT